MKKTLLLIITLFACLNSFAADWGDIMPLEDIKPGMTGTAHTVFYGEAIEPFGVEVLDVMHNFYPQLDVILVKLLGEKAEHTGVVSGMSGSPVYIDGKLVGALAFRFGQFMKEPIGGVMPIQYMLDIEKKNELGDVKTSRRNMLQHFIDAALVGVDETFWETMLNKPQQESSNSDLQIISSPLIFSGFQPEIVQQFAPYFESMGFTPVVSGNAGTAQTDDTPILKPGSAVSVALLTGDMAIEATGTVTAVSENKILAFGHELFNFGPIRLPLAATHVYATLPSLMGSSKMGTATTILGTFVQDRLSGAMGDLAQKPKMTPIRLKMQSPYHDDREYNFQLANDQALNNILPMYMRTALIQAAYTARLAGELNSTHLTGSIKLTDGRALELDDFFTSEQVFGFRASGADFVDAADLVTVLMGNLLVHDFTGPEIESVDMNMETIPGSHYALIESVWQDKTKVKPGEEVQLSINLRDNDGMMQKIERRIRIPKNIDGQRLSVFVTSGSALSRYEVQVSRDKFVPNNFDDIVRILSERRKPQNLYIQVRAMDNGLIVDGQEMLGLPPSVMNVMNTRSSGGVMQQLRDRKIYEEHITTDYVIAGAKRLLLTIDTPSKATTQNGNSQKTWY